MWAGPARSRPSTAPRSCSPRREPQGAPINETFSAPSWCRTGGTAPPGRSMQVFEIVIALLLGGAVLTLLSRRLGAPYPALVALAGAALALIPGTPTLVLDPELALTLFVAPVLLDAAS